MSSTHSILSKINAKGRDAANDLQKKNMVKQIMETADQKLEMQPGLSMDEILRQALSMGKPTPKPQSK